MTLDDLVERAKRRLMAGAGPNSPWGECDIDLTANVTVAAQLAATRVMRNPMQRPRLQQVYSVTLDGSGVGDLSTATGSVTGVANELLVEGVYLGTVIDFDGNVLQLIRHYNDFLIPQPTPFAHYHINQQKKILTRAAGSQVTIPADVIGATGPLSVTSSYVPASVTGWPAETENDLIDALVEVALSLKPRMTTSA